MFDTKRTLPATALLAACAAAAPAAHADAVTDWNIRSDEIVVVARLGTPPAIRVMAIVQTAVLDAVDAVDDTQPAASEAAVAAASRVALTRLIPTQQSAIEDMYYTALAKIADGPAKHAGIAAGETAAVAVLAARADDGASAGEAYRPHTTPGAYVPTGTPAVPQWPQRKPWLISAPSSFRPAAPPSLASGEWARALAEVKSLGAKNSARRDAEQTEIARFWEYSLPPIYDGVVRSVALAP